MAVTKIMPIRTTIQNSVNYICNPDKTDGSLLIHSENCFPKTAGLEFQHYLNQTRAGGNTIGRHLIQSFAPGEVTPEQAHEIGKQLANEILKGEYGFVLATHIDRGHVHNHFVWGAANIVTKKKYRSNKNTYHEIRKISDRLCKENELSVITPQDKNNKNRKNYENYFSEKKGTSWKRKLQIAIDNLIPESKDFEDLLSKMESQGYEIKKGKHISFKAEGQERFTRIKSLGEDYTEESIRRKISERKIIPESQKQSINEIQNLKPLIDIAGDPKYAENRGLEQWAKLQNLKNMVQAYNLMMEYGGLQSFNKIYSACRTDVVTIENGIKANNEMKKAYCFLRDNITTYNRTKAIYKQYTETKFFKEQFRKKHEKEIWEHENAAIYLRNHEKPLPKLKEINEQISRLENANVKNNNVLKEKKIELKEFKTVNSYLYHLWKENEISQQKQPKKYSRDNDLNL